jgi:hypothetical protein
MGFMFSCSPAGHDGSVVNNGTAAAAATGATPATGGTSLGGAPSTGGSTKPLPSIGGTLSSDHMGSGQCENLECAVPACAPGTTTSISGKVFAPNGTLPLYNVAVFVPNQPVEAFKDGASCDRCGANITNPVTATLTDETGAFKLENAPAGVDIPLVIQVGKWRRQLTIPAVTACVDTPLTDPQMTRLPKNKTEGDIPKIAITAGAADQMECLLPRLGIADTEFTASAGDGRIHLYGGDHNMNRLPVLAMDAAHGSTAFTAASTLWSSADAMMKYDIVILSCEGDSFPNGKPMAARTALYDYASKGGRVFASHWHNVWFAEGPNPVPTTGTWTDRQNPTADNGAATATINTTFPKGAALAKWLVNVGASTMEGQMTVTFPRDNIQAVNPDVAREWITVQNPRVEAGQDPKAVQYMSFNTPIGVPEDQVCGRAVYTDLHVAAVDNNTVANANGFPASCEMRELSAQEKAVAFMLFDLSSCVQNEDKPPPIPK